MTDEEKQDLYGVLEVARDADEEAIRKAYRHLARCSHPDVNPGDAEAEERFKAVSEAYAVLSDEEKRRNYDEFGEVSLEAGFDADPMYTSIFLANLGSIDYPAGHHHLWEYGTCSIFGVMGRIEPGPNGRRKMQLAWTYDERIEDGLYSYHALEGIRERIESPELLDISTDDLEKRLREGVVR